MKFKYVFVFVFLFLFKISLGRAAILPSGEYFIKSKLSEDKVIGYEESDIKNGTNVFLRDFNNQKFILKHLGNNYYSIESNDMALDVNGAGKHRGTNVQLYTPNNTNAQKWLIKDAGDGYFYVISKCNDLYLSILNDNIVMDNGDLKNRMFKFEEVYDNNKIIDDGFYILNSKLNDCSSISFYNDNYILKSLHYDYNQFFNIKYLYDGYYEILFQNRDFVFDDLMDNKWIIKKNYDGSYSLINNEKYLDINGANTKDGTSVQVYGGNDTLAQKFDLINVSMDKVNDGIYNIASFKNNNLVISFDNYVAVNKVNVELQNNNNFNSQKWSIKNIYDNLYEVKSVVDDNYALDLSSAGINNKQNIWLYKSNGTLAQRWRITKLSDGSYIFTNEGSSKNIDIAGGVFNNRTNIYQYQNNNTMAQRFSLLKTDKTAYRQLIDDDNYNIYSSVNLNKILKCSSSLFINDVNGLNDEIINIYYDKDGFYYFKNNDKFVTNVSGKLLLNNYTGFDNQKWFVVKNGDYYTFISKFDGKAMDLVGAKDFNGNRLQTYVSNNTSAQKFLLEKVSVNDLETGYYNIINSDKALSFAGNTPLSGSSIVLKDMNSNNQKWFIKKVGNNLYEIKLGLNLNKVMDVMNGYTRDGNKIQLYKYNGTLAQRWHIIKLKNGDYRFVSDRSHTFLTLDNILRIYTNKKKNNQSFKLIPTDSEIHQKNIDEGYYTINSVLDSNKVIDVSNGSIKNGSNIWLYSFNSSLAQIWKFKYLDNGLYEIISGLNPKKVLTSVDGNIQLEKYKGLDGQKWYINILEDGNISLESYLDNLYIDVEGARVKNGTNIQVYENNGTLAQKFILKKYGNRKTYKGIDISKWQGNINWSLLAQGNPNFIIMRVGRGVKEAYKDVRFEEYYYNASNYDIPIGVYIYSLADNFNDSLTEASLVVNWLNSKHLDLPVFYDMEYSGQLYLGKDVLTNMAETFCSYIISNNYHCGIYANAYWFTNFLDVKKLSNKYPIWLAHWTGSNNYNDALLDKYRSSFSLAPYSFWQFTDKGVYKGITENTVDLDFGYDIFD